MTQLKKLISGLLMAALLLCCLAILPYPEANAATVASGTCGDNVTWILDDTGTLTISGTGAMTDYSYTTQAPWNSRISSIKSIILEAGITSIGNFAFSNCSSLTSITIPDSVTTIGAYAFSSCKGLTSITIPDSVTSIDHDAFRFCSSLTSITIPDSVTSISSSAFFGCGGMTGLQVVKDNSVYHSAGNCIIETTSKTLIVGCNTSQIPADSSVTSIGDNAFSYRRLSNVTIPDSVTSIGRSAFYNCTSLISVTIPDSVTSLGKNAFLGCTSLISVTIPDSVTNIGDLAFLGCSNLTSIQIKEGNPVYHSAGNCIIETKSKTLIAGCRASQIPADGSVSSIGNYAFLSCSYLTDIVIPNSVTSIGSQAFESCKRLTSITIPDSVTSINSSAFKGCPINKLIIAEGSKTVTSTMVVSESTLQEVVIPDGVTDIDQRAFYDCTELLTVNIPGSVTYIGNDAFANDTSLVLQIEESNAYAISYAMVESIPYRPYSSKPSEPPTVQTVSVRKIILESIPGYEYSIDGITWQDSTEFNGLSDNQTYTFYQRTKESEFECAGAVSKGTTAKTLCEYPTIQITFDSFPTYTGAEVEIKPIITAGGIRLDEGIDYSLSYENNKLPGNSAVVIVTMIGDNSGAVYRRNFTILKADISQASVSIDSCTYSGGQKEPDPEVVMNGTTLLNGADYVVQYRNNVAVGTAYARIVGIGNYSGYIETTFKIIADTKVVTLYGKSYPSYYRSSVTIAPGPFKGICNSSQRIFSSFTLKDILTGKTLKTVDYTSMGYASDRYFYYDFSANNSATEIMTYSLAYSWTDYSGNSYLGIMTIIVTPGPEAPDSISIAQAEDDDLRYDYLSVESHWSTKIGTVVWTSSDPTVATVDNGVVEWKKSGTVTITATASGLKATKELTQEAIALSNVEMLLDATSNKIRLVYHGQVLVEGTDYVVTANTTDEYIEFTVSGCGLFSGTVTKRFDPQTGASLGVSLSGSYNSFGNANETITIQLFLSGSEEAAYTFTNADAPAVSGSWSIGGVTPGSYTVKVSKKNHVTREYTLTVTGSAAALDVEVWLIGDVTGDGLVNFSDYSKVLSQSKKPNSQLLTGYAFLSGDVNGDGTINFSDYSKVLSQAKGKHSLW